MCPKTWYAELVPFELFISNARQTNLDPVVEIAEIQRMINDHNSSIARGVSSRYGAQQIKRNVLFNGYMISPSDTQSLLSLIQLPPHVLEKDMKYLANNILITPRPCSRSILEKVGGMGNKVTWQVTEVGVFENKIWAAAVKPLPETARYYTDTRPPMIVLAHRKDARPKDASLIRDWQPVPPGKAYILDTVVGEKVLLQVEEENPAEGEWERLFPPRNVKRRHAQEADIPPSQAVPVQQRQHYYRDEVPPRPAETSRREAGTSSFRHQQYPGNNRGRGGGYRGSRGGGLQRGHRGDRGGGSYRGRGRGGPPYGYRSLDDAPVERTFSAGRFGGDGTDDPRYDGGVREGYSGGVTGGLPYNG